MDANTTTTATWRDFLDQLTPLQVNRYLERDLMCPGDADWAELLAGQARYDAEANCRDRTLFGNVPEPAGAELVYHWERAGDNGPYVRGWEGRTVEVGHFVADIRGTQLPNGAVTATSNIECHSQGFTVEELRRIAAGLVEIADELERIAGT